LMCGFDRAVYPNPVPYPTACSPQAWASATPVYLLRALIGAEPCVPRGVLALDPALPDKLGSLEVRGVLLGNTRVTLVIQDGRSSVKGLRDEIEVVTGHRPCYWKELASDRVAG
jgi:hypothetical protein